MFVSTISYPHFFLLIHPNSQHTNNKAVSSPPNTNKSDVLPRGKSLPAKPRTSPRKRLSSNSVEQPPLKKPNPNQNSKVYYDVELVRPFAPSIRPKCTEKSGKEEDATKPPSEETAIINNKEIENVPDAVSYENGYTAFCHFCGNDSFDCCETLYGEYVYYATLKFIREKEMRVSELDIALKYNDCFNWLVNGSKFFSKERTIDLTNDRQPPFCMLVNSYRMVIDTANREVRARRNRDNTH